MIHKLQRKYALSEQGARDLIKGCIACVLQNLSFMFPVGLVVFVSVPITEQAVIVPLLPYPARQIRPSAYLQT